MISPKNRVQLFKAHDERGNVRSFLGYLGQCRIEGHPAKKLSFWIEQADFVRQYEKIGEFWLSRRDEAFVQARLYGNKVLTTDHWD